MRSVVRPPSSVSLPTGLISHTLVFCLVPLLFGQPLSAASSDTAAQAGWRWAGEIGRRTDAVSAARLQPTEAWNRIYPETEEAFRLRQDDAAFPRAGLWRGEFWGKYILSVLAAQRYYDDMELKARIHDAARGVLRHQEVSGYLGTYRRSDFFGPGTWNIWNRKYTLWGLVEAWRLTGDRALLEGACRMTDHLISEVGPAGKSIVQTGQFVGLPSTSILTPVVLLYRATREPRYLEFARYIADQWSRHPSGLPDLWKKGLEGAPIHTWPGLPARDWAKSYEFMSCVEGLVLLHQETGDPSMLLAARNLHRLIREWERSPVGSVSFNDKFIGSRFVLNIVGELCDVVYWNRLSHALYLITRDADYLEEIERSLYNALMCGLKEDGSWGLRRLRLTHEHIPAHKHFLEHHQCCVDNLPRGLFQAAESALSADEKGIWLGLYAPGQGFAIPKGGPRVAVRLEGDFLRDQPLTLAVEPERAAAFTIHLRRPAWCPAMEVLVNGAPWKTNPAHQAGAASRWISVTREWKRGDRVQIQLHAPFHAEYFDPSFLKGQQERVSEIAREWGTMGVVEQDPVTKKNRQRRTVAPEDALPHRRAYVLLKGPIVLARDARLGDVDPLAHFPRLSAPLPSGFGIEIPSPDGIRRAYRLRLSETNSITVCDFASAGNTWDARSRFAAWFLEIE